MPRPSEGPKSPTPEEIEQLVDLINDYISQAEQGDQGPSTNVRIGGLQRLIEILDWSLEQVNKRRAYSKKFQLKEKARTALLIEKLGPDEYKEVVENAKRAAANGLFEEVANGQPERDDIAFAQSRK